ncbi:elastin-like [Macrobrachium rosenbergii]|uniref:elastin-like n=1 Tax=Macrobrachium rosenbergii TaxID=79674 RepID=UPI0034D52A92
MEIRPRSPRQFCLLFLLLNCAAAAAAAAAADSNGRPRNKRNDGPIRFGSPFPIAGPIPGPIAGPIPGPISGPIAGPISGPIPGLIRGPFPIGGQRYSPFRSPIVGGAGRPPLPPLGPPIPGFQPPPSHSLVPPPLGRNLGSGFGFNPVHPLGAGSFTAPPIHLHYPHGASPFTSAHQLSPPGHLQGPASFGAPLQHVSKPIQPSQPLVNALPHEAAPDLKEGKICHDCEVGKHSSHFKVHDAGPVRQVVTSSLTPHVSLQSPGSFTGLGIGNFGGGIGAVSGTQGGFLHGGGSDFLGFGARIPGHSALSPFGGGVSHSGGLGGGFGGSLHPGSSFGGSLHPGGGLGTSLTLDNGISSYSSI